MCCLSSCMHFRWFAKVIQIVAIFFSLHLKKLFIEQLGTTVLAANSILQCLISFEPVLVDEYSEQFCFFNRDWFDNIHKRGSDINFFEQLRMYPKVWRMMIFYNVYLTWSSFFFYFLLSNNFLIIVYTMWFIEWKYYCVLCARESRFRWGYILIFVGLWLSISLMPKMSELASTWCQKN